MILLGVGASVSTVTYRVLIVEKGAGHCQVAPGGIRKKRINYLTHSQNAKYIDLRHGGRFSCM